MEVSKKEIFSCQLLHYLVFQGYHFVEVENPNETIWLVNETHKTYPVICIFSSKQRLPKADEIHVRSIHRTILNDIKREGILLILNMHPQGSVYETPYFLHVSLIDQKIIHHGVVCIFKNINHCFNYKKNNQDEIANLTREMEEKLWEQKDQSKPTIKEKHPINVSLIIVGLSVIFSITVYICNLVFNWGEPTYVVFGAYYKMNIIAANEYWRFLSSWLIHDSLIQLTLQGMAFYYISRNSERYFTRLQFWTILFSTILISNLFSLILDENMVHMGISSIVVGQSAALMTMMIIVYHKYRVLIQSIMIRYSLIFLIMMLIPNMSFARFMGAALCGFFCGFVFSHNMLEKQVKKHLIIASGALCILLLYFSSRPLSVRPLHKELDTSVVSFYEKHKITTYAKYLKKCYNKEYGLLE